VDFPTEERLRWILRCGAQLLAGGAEPVSGLVLPTSKFFPDHFDGRPASINRLLERVAGHAGLGDASLSLDIVGAEGSGDRCGSSGCCSTGGPTPQISRVKRESTCAGDRYVVAVLPQEIGNPTVLTTAFVRAVSHIFMLEAALHEEVALPEAEVAIDLAGVLLGFGVLLANGSYIYSKGCGGVRIGSATKLPVQEIAVALAVYCRLNDVAANVLQPHLEPTPRDHFVRAIRWAKANVGVIQLMRDDPEVLQADGYALAEGRSWLAKLFGSRSKRAASVPTDDELQKVAESLGKPKSTKPVDPAKEKRLEQLRELVDEALDS